MRCSEARAAIHERQLATLDPPRAGALGLHLESCATCAAEARLETGITAALAELRRECPVEIDATSTVMSRIAALGPVERAEVPDRHIAWGAAAALIAGAALLVSGAGFLPYLPRAMAPAAALARGLLTVIGDFAALVAQVISAPLRALGEAALRSMATDVLPVGFGIVTVACLLMATTMAVVVGRDLLRPGAGARGMLA